MRVDMCIGTVYDGACSYNFGNDFARNAINFLLIIVHHLRLILMIIKIKLSVLGEELTDKI